MRTSIENNLNTQKSSDQLTQESKLQNNFFNAEIDLRYFDISIGNLLFRKKHGFLNFGSHQGEEQNNDI